MGGDNVQILNAGLPNITGEFASIWGRNPNSEGALYSVSYNASTLEGGTAWNGTIQLGFSAERSNTIYGASNTVQPPAISLLPQIKF